MARYCFDCFGDPGQAWMCKSVITVGHLCNEFNASPGGSCEKSKNHPPPLFRRPACKLCKKEQPVIPAHTPVHTIPLIGPTGGGKSHFLVALNQWWKEGFRNLDLTVVPCMSQEREDKFEEMVNKVRGIDPQPLPATPRTEAWSYAWNFIDPVNPAILNFCESSGEDQPDKDAAISVHRFLPYTTGVIVVLDGDRMLESFSRGQVVGRRNPGDHEKVIRVQFNELSAFRKEKHLPNIPVAVCLNKMDKLIRHQDIKQYIESAPPSNGAPSLYPIGAKKRRSDLLRRILLQNNPNIVRLIESYDMTYQYFAMQGLGADAEPTKGVLWLPGLVEEPLLWLLSQWDVIPSREG